MAKVTRGKAGKFAPVPNNHMGGKLLVTVIAVILAYELYQTMRANGYGQSINGSLWRRLPPDRAKAQALAANDPTGAVQASINSVDTAANATDAAASQEQAAGLLPSY